LKINMEADMKAFMGCAALALVLATASAADAKGCLKGAAAGGTVGHFAGHQGLLGAAAGCAMGRHQANKKTAFSRTISPTQSRARATNAFDPSRADHAHQG
jgi:hypothetical protein